MVFGLRLPRWPRGGKAHPPSKQSSDSWRVPTSASPQDFEVASEADTVAQHEPSGRHTKDTDVTLSSSRVNRAAEVLIHNAAPDYEDLSGSRPGATSTTQTFSDAELPPPPACIALDAAPISAHQARHRCGLRSTEGRAEQYQNKDGHITVLHPDSGPIFGGPAVAADSSSRAQEWVDVDAYDALGADASAAWNKGDEMQAWLLQKLHHGLGSAARLQGALAVALKSWPLPDLVSGSASDGSSAGSPRPQVRPGRAAATAAGTDSDAPYPAPTRSGSASFIGALDQNTAGSGLLKPQAERGEAAAVAADPDSWVVLGSDPVFRQPTFEDVPSPLPKIDEEVVLNYLNGIMDENSSDLDTISLSSSADHWMDQAGQQVVQATCSPLGTGPNLPSSAYWKATSDTLDEVLALPAKIHHYTYVDSAQQLQEASTERSQEASTRVQQNKETLRRRAEWTAKWLQDNPTQPRIPRRSWAHSELVTA